MNSNRKLILQLCGATLGMFLFGFALVPLYDVFCDITGLNGKVELVASKSTGIIDTSREITVQFIANTNENMPWQFIAKDVEVKVHPGENARADFFVKNLSSSQMVGQAIVSVSPAVGAKYFHKTQCFCFDRQVLEAKQGQDVSVLFSVDTKLPEGVKKITLSYTFFDITELQPLAAN
jgi:cytochrome c oxidase assembly protein subunit 11